MSLFTNPQWDEHLWSTGNTSRMGCGGGEWVVIVYYASSTLWFDVPLTGIPRAKVPVSIPVQETQH